MYKGHDTATGEVTRTATAVDLVFGSNSQLRAIAAVYAEDAALFAADLARMYQRLAETRGWRWEVVEAAPTELGGYRESELVKLDMLINNEQIDAFSVIIHRDKAYEWGRKVAEKLKELIPR